MRAETVGELIGLLKRFSKSKRVFVDVGTFFCVKEIREDNDNATIDLNTFNDNCHLFVCDAIETLEEFDYSRKVYVTQLHSHFFIQDLYEGCDGDVIIYCISEPMAREE